MLRRNMGELTALAIPRQNFASQKKNARNPYQSSHKRK